MVKSHDFQAALLKWYDRYRRTLPWRAAPGVRANPYHVWLSEIMLQQTTVATVIPYFEKFLKLWPDIHAFARAPQEQVLKEWAGLGYYARARNLHKGGQVIADRHSGEFPGEYDRLLELPGIGPYTAAAISAIAFNKHAVVIDGNIERVTARVFSVEKTLKEAKADIRKNAEHLFAGIERVGDFAQALMDLGATICIPQNPRCALCPVNGFCAAYKKGVQNCIPVKAVRKSKPQRSGLVYWLVTREGDVCLERRAENRMLGGMIGLPTSDWDGKQAIALSSRLEKELEYAGDVYHSFTHFDLKLEIRKARIGKAEAEGFLRLKPDKILSAGLPTIFKKVAKAMLAP